MTEQKKQNKKGCADRKSLGWGVRLPHLCKSSAFGPHAGFACPVPCLPRVSEVRCIRGNMRALKPGGGWNRRLSEG